MSTCALYSMKGHKSGIEIIFFLETIVIWNVIFQSAAYVNS